MKAVVMAGGFGTRIQPLTNSVPKPMLPVANIPMMQHIIEKLRDANIKDIVILLYFKPEVIKDYFGNGSGFGVNIEYVLPDDDYGTAGAVKKAEPFLDETFMIVSGDLVTDFDFKKIVDFHEAKKSKLTITLTSVVDPLQFGVVITDAEGKIQKFLEKPSWGEVFSDTINTGIYILEPEILGKIPEGENYDFGKNLFPLLMEEGITLWGCTVEGYWRDVGNPKSYRDVHLDILNQDVLLNLRGSKIEYPSGTLYKADSAKIEDSVKVEGIVVLDEDALISSGVVLKNVIVGKHCSIGKDTEIENSTIWHDCTIGEKAKISNAVICNNNKIGKKTKIKEGAIIAEGCEIDALVSFEKDVIVWPEKMIEEASVISNNIIWGTKYKASIFEGGKVVGRANLELYAEMATKIAESFGSMLPVGSKVYLSRDYHKSSRMIKRAVLVGLISTGLDAIDVRVLPSNVMRYNLAKDSDIVAGIHVRQSVDDATSTEILFFTSEGLPIDTNTEKNCERIFFRENFRRVGSDEIGEIVESDVNYISRYESEILSKIDKEQFRNYEQKIVADLLFGSASNLFPDIINRLDIDNIIINAYSSDKKLSKLSALLSSAQDNVAKIVKSLEYDVGFVIFPNGQKLRMVGGDGQKLPAHIALLTVVQLLDRCVEAPCKVFLPVNAPDILDDKLKFVSIERGKFTNFTNFKLKDYLLVANMTGNFAFTDLTYNYDSVFASLKILELLSKTKLKLNEITAQIPSFFYKEESIECPSDKKGKMMRKFMEEGKDREASYIDGIKFWLNSSDWVLMIPATAGEFVNLYVQAKDSSEGEKLFSLYKNKIEEWKREE